MTISKKTEKATMRAMGGIKLIKKRRSQELMSLMGLKVALNGFARANRIRWNGHALKRNNGAVLRKALHFEVAERRGRGQPK